jgi:hypothetical protein
MHVTRAALAVAALAAGLAAAAALAPPAAPAAAAREAAAAGAVGKHRKPKPYTSPEGLFIQARGRLRGIRFGA